jgi:hypothetical protein
VSRDGHGVALIGRILAHLACEGPCSAGDLAKHLSSARATTFDVLRRLEAAGFVDRDAQGLVSPGQASADLGFSWFGIVRGAGVSEALLPALRDDIEATVELVVRRADDETVLARRSAAGPPASKSGLERRVSTLERPVRAGRATGVHLRLSSAKFASAADRKAVGHCLETVAAALSQSFTRTDGDPW